MQSTTEVAHAELTAAHRHGTEALAALQSIQQRPDFRIKCACNERGACAYHAGLINRTFDALRILGEVLEQTRADLADPSRKV
jgi:hypothetical protein